MDSISTIILIRELDKRVFYYDGSDEFLCNITEQSVQSLKESLNSCLEEYTDVILQRVQDNMEHFENEG
jgi:hypothetical protein